MDCGKVPTIKTVAVLLNVLHVRERMRVVSIMKLINTACTTTGCLFSGASSIQHHVKNKKSVGEEAEEQRWKRKNKEIAKAMKEKREKKKTGDHKNLYKKKTHIATYISMNDRSIKQPISRPKCRKAI